MRGEHVTLEPLEPVHFPALRRILATPEVQRRWRAADTWPDDGSDARRFAVLHDEQVIGLVQYGEEADPEYRHASVDIFLDPSVHGRGLGRDAVRALVLHLIRDRGHHRVSIDPAVDNEPAIRCYTAVGFRPVGVMRQYEQDPDGEGWHDNLLMDLLAEELQE